MTDETVSSTSLIVRLACEEDRARWNGFVDCDARASVYHRFEWVEIFQRVYRQRACSLLVERDRRVVGVLPLICLDRGPFGLQLVSLPYFGHGGALADTPAAWWALVHRARDLASELGASHVELRHAHSIPPHDLPARQDKVLMHRRLPDTVAALEKEIGSKMRNDVRRTVKEGITTEVGGRELVGHFHDVYSAVMRDLGSPCHSAAVFEEAIVRFADRAFVVRAVYQGRTVGAAFLVGQGDTLEVPCAGSLRAFNKLRVNTALYWAILCEAIRRGYKIFSFGRSTRDSGTYVFKKGWGAVPVPLPYHYLLTRPGAVPAAHQDNPLLRTMSSWWTRLPLPVANALGPRLVRYFA